MMTVVVRDGGGVMTVAVRDGGGVMTVRDGGRGDDSSEGLRVGRRGSSCSSER